jgi:hypothetical protein
VSIKDFAEQLSDVLLRIEDAKCEGRAILDAAKEAGVNVSALRKVAQEMVMDSTKLAKKYDAEEQLDMFRQEVGIFKAKGLAETDKAMNARKVQREKGLVKAAKELDAIAGSDIAESYQNNMKALRKWDANREAAE